MSKKQNLDEIIKSIDKQAESFEVQEQPKEYDDIIKDLSEKFSSAKIAKAEIEEDFEEAAEEYENLLEASTDGLANIKDPILFTIIQTKIADELASSPRVAFHPKKQEDIDKVETTKAAFYDSTNRNEFNFNIYKCFLSKDVYGTGIGREEYSLKKRQVQDIEYTDKGKKILKDRVIYDEDDLKLSYVDPRRFYPDPKATSIQNMTYCFELDDADFDEFMMYAKNNPAYMQDQLAKVLPSTGLGETYPYNLPFQLNEEEQKEGAGLISNRVLLVIYFNYIRDEYMIVANDILVLKSPNPYAHKKIPYIRFVNYLEMDSFWGRSDYRVIKQIIEEKNHFKNSIIDWGKININRPILLGQTDFEDEDINFGPGAIWKVGDIGQIKLLDLGDIPEGMFGIDARLNEDITSFTGVDIRSLIASAEETATKTALKQEKSLKRIGMGLKVVDWTAIEPWARMRLSNIQQFYTKKRIEMIDDTPVKKFRNIRVSDRIVLKDGDGNIKFVDSKGSSGFFEAEPKYITGQLDVEAVTGSTLNASKEADRQNLNGFLQSIVPYPQIIQQYDPRAMAEELAKKNNLDLSRIMVQPAGEADNADIESDKSTKDFLSDNGVVKPGMPAPKIPGEPQIPGDMPTGDLLTAMGVMPPTVDKK